MFRRSNFHILENLESFQKVTLDPRIFICSSDHCNHHCFSQPSRKRTTNTLQGTNISQLWKRKIIFKSVLGGDIMLVPRRVSRIFLHVRHVRFYESFGNPVFIRKIPSIFPSLGGRVVLASLQWFSHLIGEVRGCWRLEELCWILGLQTPWYWGGPGQGGEGGLGYWGYWDVMGRKLGSKVIGSVGYKPDISNIAHLEVGYYPFTTHLITSWDILVFGGPIYSKWLGSPLFTIWKGEEPYLKGLITPGLVIT